jgi:uncharacterized membrane-anchored protein YitT (DUF2179 family)
MKRISIQNIIRRLIIHTVLRYKHHSKGTSRVYTPLEMAKGFREFKINTWTSLKDILLNIVGIFSAAFGLESFLLPNGFIDGGATGISLLLAKLMDMPVAILLIIVNVPFVIFGYNIISKPFAWRASLSIIGLAIVVSLCHFPEVTNDRLLVSVFGGFFLGVGIGLSMRGGAVLDGTEVIAISISRKVGITVGDIILLINCFIFGTAAYLLSIETALYSILTYLAASKTVDFILEGIEEYTGVTVVSPKSEEIRLMIIHKLRRGVTIYKGIRGYGKNGDAIENDIVFTVITRLEVSKLNLELQKIDPKAFVVMGSIKDTKGGMIKKRAHKRYDDPSE